MQAIGVQCLQAHVSPVLSVGEVVRAYGGYALARLMALLLHTAVCANGFKACTQREREYTNHHDQ